MLTVVETTTACLLPAGTPRSNKHVLNTPTYLLDQRRDCIWPQLYAADSVYISQYPRVVGTICKLLAMYILPFFFAIGAIGVHGLPPNDLCMVFLDTFCCALLCSILALHNF